MKQILILGGGPAGLQLIKTLRVARLKADITLVDRSESYTPNTRYGVFFGRSEPYKTRASSALLFTALAKKYDFTFVQAEVLGVDLAKRQAQLQGRRLEADVLVLALGSAYKEQVSSVFKHSYPVWTLDQLFELQKLLEAALQAKKMQAKGEPLRIVLIGGLLLKALKKLYGARLGTPSALTVLAKAIGRGATAPRIYWCRSLVAIWVGSIFSMNGYL
jgi:NADH dehydrogenase FAD-containing subunit